MRPSRFDAFGLQNYKQFPKLPNIIEKKKPITCENLQDIDFVNIILLFRKEEWKNYQASPFPELKGEMVRGS